MSEEVPSDYDDERLAFIHSSYDDDEHSPSPAPTTSLSSAPPSSFSSAPTSYLFSTVVLVVVVVLVLIVARHIWNAAHVTTISIIDPLWRQQAHLFTPPSSPLLNHTLSPSLSLSFDDVLPPHTNRSVCVARLGGRMGNHIYMLMTSLSIAQHLHVALFLPSSRYGIFFPYWNALVDTCPTASTQWSATADYGSVDLTSLTNASIWKSDVSASLTLHGWLQICSAFYRPHIPVIRTLMKIDDDINNVLQMTKEVIIAPFCAHSLIIPVHLRRGDFGGTNFGIVPVSYYVDWLHHLQSNGSEVLRQAKLMQDRECTSSQGFSFDPSRVVVIVISDDPDSTSEEFKMANVRIIRSLHAYTYASDLFGLSEKYTGANLNVLVDWWLLGQFPISAYSHSTFSFTAAMLSRYSESNHGFFYRADPKYQKMIQFDPWDLCFTLQGRF